MSTNTFKDNLVGVNILLNNNTRLSTVETNVANEIDNFVKSTNKMKTDYEATLSQTSTDIKAKVKSNTDKLTQISTDMVAVRNAADTRIPELKTKINNNLNSSISTLQTSLSTKADSGHSHGTTYSSSTHSHGTTYSSSTHSHTTYATSSHTHAASDITDLKQDPSYTVAASPNVNAAFSGQDKTTSGDIAGEYILSIGNIVMIFCMNTFVRSEDGGITWSITNPFSGWSNNYRQACYNPVSKKLYAYAYSYLENRNVIVSSDYGKTWSTIGLVINGSPAAMVYAPHNQSIYISAGHLIRINSNGSWQDLYIEPDMNNFTQDLWWYGIGTACGFNHMLNLCFLADANYKLRVCSSGDSWETTDVPVGLGSNLLSVIFKGDANYSLITFYNRYCYVCRNYSSKNTMKSVSNYSKYTVTTEGYDSWWYTPRAAFCNECIFLTLYNDNNKTYVEFVSTNYGATWTKNWSSGFSNTLQRDLGRHGSRLIDVATSYVGVKNFKSQHNYIDKQFRAPKFETTTSYASGCGDNLAHALFAKWRALGLI